MEELLALLRPFTPPRVVHHSTPAMERLVSGIDYQGDDACWEWRGYRNQGGYGNIKYDGREQPVHRLVYELLVGAVPDGLQLDHLCRNRACCNPSHLEPVTPRENALRGIGPTARNAAKTSCVNGHPFEESNTYLRLGATGNLMRACRECARRRTREWIRAKRKAAA